MGNIKNELENKDNTIKMLIYGPEHSRKTWWTGLLATLNYNVIYLNSDNGLSILKQIPEAYLDNITAINISDFPDRAVAFDFMGLLAQHKPFSWNNTKRIQGTLKNASIGEEIISIIPKNLSSSDVIILDSFTSLVDSSITSYGIVNNTPMDDADLFDWNYYYREQQALNYLLRSLISLPCHVIVIAHELKTDIMKRIGDKDKKVGEETIIMSSSKNHAKSIARMFSDILHFEIQDGGRIFISNARMKNKISGSRVRPPVTETWKDLGPDKFFPKSELPSEHFPIIITKKTEILEDKDKEISSEVSMIIGEITNELNPTSFTNANSTKSANNSIKPTIGQTVSLKTSIKGTL